MKKLLLIALLFVGANSFGQFQDSRSLQQVVNLPIDVVCIGTSLTAGSGSNYPNGTPVNAATQSYPAQLGQLLGTNYTITNYGVPGASLQDILNNQIPQVVQRTMTVAGPSTGGVYGLRVMFFEGDANDVTQNALTVQQISDLKKQIIQAGVTAGYKVVLKATPAYNNNEYPVNHDAAAGNVRRLQVQSLDSTYFKTTYKCVGYIGQSAPYDKFVGYGNQNLLYYQTDGIHKTPMGYGLDAQQCYEAIKTIEAGGTYLRYKPAALAPIIVNNYYGSGTNTVVTNQAVDWSMYLLPNTTFSNNVLTATPLGQNWNFGSSGSLKIVNGDCAINLPSQVGSDFIVGFSDVNLTNTGYNAGENYKGIKYGAYLSHDNFTVFEKGANPITAIPLSGAHSVSVKVENGVVNYYLDGVLKYTSTQTLTYPLIPVASLNPYTSGSPATVTNAVISGNAVTN